MGRVGGSRTLRAAAFAAELSAPSWSSPAPRRAGAARRHPDPDEIGRWLGWVEADDIEARLRPRLHRPPARIDRSTVHVAERLDDSDLGLCGFDLVWAAFRTQLSRRPLLRLLVPVPMNAIPVVPLGNSPRRPRNSGS